MKIIILKRNILHYSTAFWLFKAPYKHNKTGNARNTQIPAGRGAASQRRKPRFDPELWRCPCGICYVLLVAMWVSVVQLCLLSHEHFTEIIFGQHGGASLIYTITAIPSVCFTPLPLLNFPHVSRSDANRLTRNVNSV